MLTVISASVNGVSASFTIGTDSAMMDVRVIKRNKFSTLLLESRFKSPTSA